MNLKALRTKLNLTQKQLADLMNTTQQTVARWENEKTPLNTAHIKQLCGILHCTAQELMGWDFEDEGGFDTAMLSDYGLPYGTLRLTFAFGAKEFPIGEVARDEVDGFLSGRSILNRRKHNSAWLALTTMGKRLLLVNPAAIRTLAIISDDIAAMPSFGEEEGYEVDASDENEFHQPIPAKELVRVAFTDGTEKTYRLSQAAADDIYAILAGNHPEAGSMLVIEEHEAGHLRTYVNSSEVAMIELSAALFDTMTTDFDGDVAAYE